MEEWRKMFELYIHDYLVRKNLHTTADIFAQEANIQPRSVVIDTPEGFLSEWWSVFWDVYRSRVETNQLGEQTPTSEPPQSSAPVPQISQPISLAANDNYIPQNICPLVAEPKPSEASNLATVPMPEIGGWESMISPRIIDPTLNARDAEHSFGMHSWSSSSGSRKRRAVDRHPSPLSQGVNIGAGSRRPTTSTLTPRAPLILESAEQADAGCQAGRAYELGARASGKLIISEPSTKKVRSTILDDGSKGKGLLIEKSREMEDEDIGRFLSIPENTNMSFTHTLPQGSSHCQKDQQGFPFRMVRTLHPTDNKLSCCDFSTHGRYLAAGGHEKKVILWNLSLSSRETLQGHTQLITDVRFQPNSSLFATSSFDRTVKIWDAINPNLILSNLVGHEDQVTSVDFHTKSPDLLCSCDSNDIIRLWNIKDSTCLGFYKGGNKQVRFQPRQGNLLAAATGNTINLIDVETGVIQQRFEGHEKEIRSMCWDVCGENLVSTSEDSTRIWSLVNGGKCVHKLHLGGTDFTSSTFHPGYSQVVAIGSYQSIYIWNPMMGSKTWTFPAHEGIISAMANASETNMMASVSHDQRIKLWR